MHQKPNNNRRLEPGALNVERVRGLTRGHLCSLAVIEAAEVAC
jgi:hypothetical protein